AAEISRRDVALQPHNASSRGNLGLYELYGGNFEPALGDLRKAIAINPSFVIAHQGVAYAQVATGRIADARETYARLQTFGANGASVAAMGLADLALYQGHAKEAADI